MKIPTMLGISLLVIATVLAVYLFKANQVTTESASLNFSPQNIQVVNLTNKAATIIWQTQTPSTGLITFGSTESLGTPVNDDRDQGNETTHRVHIATLTNLSPNTQYFFKIRSGTYFYPNQPLKFETGPSLSQNSASFNQPIFGVILSPSLTPVDEAVVELNLKDSSSIATVTTTAGNFILPLVDLRSFDLSKGFPLDQTLNATLIVSEGTLKSEIKIKLPGDNLPLPNIVLGQNSDFSSQPDSAPSSSSATFKGN